MNYYLKKNTFYLKTYIFGLTLFIDAKKKTMHLLQPIKPKIKLRYDYECLH